MNESNEWTDSYLLNFYRGFNEVNRVQLLVERRKNRVSTRIYTNCSEDNTVYNKYYR